MTPREIYLADLCSLVTLTEEQVIDGLFTHESSDYGVFCAWLGESPVSPFDAAYVIEKAMLAAMTYIFSTVPEEA